MVFNEKNSILCASVKKRSAWDKIFMAPLPRSRVIREGYRFKITHCDEEEIEAIKKILAAEHVLFEDRIATSESERVRPGDRTLRVIHQNSVANLRSMWTKEAKRKNPLYRNGGR